MKRYNLVLPDDLYDQVEQQAKAQGVTIVELLRRFIRFGLLIAKYPDAELIINEGGKEKRLLIV